MTARLSLGIVRSGDRPTSAPSSRSPATARALGCGDLRAHAIGPRPVGVRDCLSPDAPTRGQLLRRRPFKTGRTTGGRPGDGGSSRRAAAVEQATVLLLDEFATTAGGADCWLAGE